MMLPVAYDPSTILTIVVSVWFIADSVYTLATWRLRRQKLRAAIALLETEIKAPHNLAPEGAKE